MLIEEKDGGIYREGSDGYLTEQLTNFTAEIKTQIVAVDDEAEDIVYCVVGKCRGNDLPELQVPAPKFDSMGWVSRWGLGPIVYPHHDKSAACSATFIKEQSFGADTLKTYLCTGWHHDEDGWHFISHNEAVYADGTQSVETDLPGDLKRMQLSGGKHGVDGMPSMCGCVGPMLHMYAIQTVFGGTDFTLWLHGRSGSFKSSIAACALQYFGDYDHRHLTAGWNSTANSLEALCNYAKDTLVCIDDYVPTGNSYEQKSLERSAERLVRGLANQQGRGRLDESSKLQQTMWPRCGILATGEDVVGCGSLRGRMLILECSKGAIDKKALTKLQSQSLHRRAAMCQFVNWLAADWEAYKAQFATLSEEYAHSFMDSGGHERTPFMLGRLLAGYDLWCQCFHDGLGKYEDWAREQLLAAAAQQGQHLKQADNATHAVEIIRDGLTASTCHLQSSRGGEPDKGLRFGWKASAGGHGHTAGGKMLGYYDSSTREVYFLPNEFHEFVKRKSSGQIGVTAQTLRKRMFEGGFISEHGGRYVTRRRIAGHLKNVVVMPLDVLFDEESMPAEPTADEAMSDFIDNLPETWDAAF